MATFATTKGGGVSSIGAVSSDLANGATISGSVLTLGTATNTNPGLVSTGVQTFAGVKTFGDGLAVPTAKTIAFNAGATTLIQDVAGDLQIDVASAKGMNFKVNGSTVVSFSSAGRVTSSENFIAGAGVYLGDGNISSNSTNVAVTIGGKITSGSGGNIARIYNQNGTSAGDYLLRMYSDNAASTLAIGWLQTGKAHIPSGANGSAGLATLVGGTVTVSTTAVKTGDLIYTSRMTTGGTLGHLSAPTASIVDATSFVINSSSGTDTSTVTWRVIKN